MQALAESFAASTRKAKLPAARASSLIDSWLQPFPCHGATTETLRIALRAEPHIGSGFGTRCSGRSPVRPVCRDLLSEDFQTGRTLGGVTFVNPFAPAGMSAEVERLLGPG